MAWVSRPSNITISTLGGSATSVATTNNDHTTNPVHKLEWVCSYSSSGVLTMSMYFTATSSMGTCMGSTLSASATVNGRTYAFLSPGTSFNGTTVSERVKIGENGTWTIKDTTSISVSLDIDMWCGSDTEDNSGWGPSPKGGMTGSFTITVPRVSDTTACTAPTSFTSGSTFYGNLNGGDGDVTVWWSGAHGGTNNAATGYTIEARYPGGDWYYKWSGMASSATLNFDGEAGKTITIDLRIRTEGTAGPNYYSGWKNGSVVALGRTACTAPTNVYINSNSDSAQYVNPGSTVKLYWSGAAGGLNNAISRYYIQRRKNGGAWGAASDYNASSGDAQSLDNTEGAYFEFQVRTEGAAGSSYYSGYKLSRNRVYNRSKPTVGTPTVLCPLSLDRNRNLVRLHENRDRPDASIYLEWW